MKHFLLLLAFSMLFFSCKKEEGEGGNASIKGKIITKRYTVDYSTYITSYAAKDQDVFIQYGNNTGVSDKTTTDYNGEFTFNYLYPGDYTVFVYSEDTTLNDLSGKIVIKQSVHLNKKESKNIELTRADNN